MKIFSCILLIVIGNYVFSQRDTVQINHSHKISNLLNKVNSISEDNIEHKHIIVNKSKIDSLMYRIDEMKVPPIQTIEKSSKFDSIYKLYNDLKVINLQKDSLIATLKSRLEKQQQTTLTNSNSSIRTKNYIVLGAFLQKNNALNQLNKLKPYHVEMIPVGRLIYIVYTLKSNEKITPTLLKFKKQIEPNAWIISL